jgi:large subunit ribosomal protein L21
MMSLTHPAAAAAVNAAAVAASSSSGSLLRGLQRQTAAALRSRLSIAAAPASIAGVLPAASPAAAFHTSLPRLHNRPHWPIRSAQHFRDVAAAAHQARQEADLHARLNALPFVRVTHVHPQPIEAADEGAQVASGIAELEMNEQQPADASAAADADADADPERRALRQLLTTPAAHFAVVRHRGTQFKVIEDDLVMLDRISGPGSAVGTQLRLKDVLLMGGRDATLVGRPRVAGAEVLATIEEHTQTAKVVVFKKKRRKGYKKKAGHRDMVTVVRINKILLPHGSEPLTVGSHAEFADKIDVEAEKAELAAQMDALLADRNTAKAPNPFKAERVARRAAREDIAAAAATASAAGASIAAAAAGQRAYSTLTRRSFSTVSEVPSSSADASAAAPRTNEATIEQLLRRDLGATALHIEDTSGGCGAFFKLLVVSPQFTGLSLVKQHRLVNQILKPHIANLHGLTLTTVTEEAWAEHQQKQKQQQKRAS